MIRNLDVDNENTSEVEGCGLKIHKLLDLTKGVKHELRISISIVVTHQHTEIWILHNLYGAVGSTHIRYVKNLESLDEDLDTLLNSYISAGFVKQPYRGLYLRDELYGNLQRAAFCLPIPKGGIYQKINRG